MLRCVRRYRSASRGLFVEPGEVVHLDPALEAWLLRDDPAAWERTTETRALDAPPHDAMVHREQATRKDSERTPGGAMTTETHRALTRRE